MKKTDLNKKRNYTEKRIDRRFIEDAINDLPCGHDYDPWDEEESLFSKLKHPSIYFEFHKEDDVAVEGDDFTFDE
jgi:hypothetical protein